MIYYYKPNCGGDKYFCDACIHTSLWCIDNNAVWQLEITAYAQVTDSQLKVCTAHAFTPVEQICM